MFYLPKPIYDILPYLYGATGLIVIVALRNGWGLFSGAIFLATALMVYQMRLVYRKALVMEQSSNDDNMNLVRLVWRPAFECGNPLINEQHRHLFALSNELLDAMLTGKPKKDIEVLLYLFRDDVVNHFRAEESLLSSENHPFFADHAKLHTELLDKTDLLIDKYLKGSLGLGEVFEFIGHELVAMHISQEDKLFYM